MKVLLATEWFPPDIGGVASHVRDLAVNLRSRGHDIAIVTRKREDRGEWPFEVIELEHKDFLKFLWGLSGNGVIKKILDDFDPDIVHAHHAFTPIPLASIFSASINGYPTVLTNHSAYLYDYNYLLKTLGFVAFPFRSIIGKADEVIAVSNAAARFIGNFAPSVPLKIIPNGVDTERFNPKGSRRLREEVEADFIVLYVGRLVYRKGVHHLVEAMKLLAKREPGILLVIAGDGPLKRSLREKVESLGLDKQVLFLGRVDDSLLPDLYRSSDVFVMPSLFGESFGIVALEAMASGIPVIASAIGGLKEIIIDGVNGILLRDVNPETIADEIYRLYLDDTLRLYLSRKAREHVEKNYSWRNITRRIEEEYVKLLEEAALKQYDKRIDVFHRLRLKIPNYFP